MSTPRTAIYARVSKANAAGETVSVDEQVKALTALADKHGGTVVATFADRAVSASGAGRNRPGWAALLRMIEAEEVDAVALWETSRASRRLDEWSAFRALCRDHSVLWLTPDAGLVDPYGSRDRMSLGVKAVVAEEEAEQTSQRIKRTVRERAAAGSPHGREVYGYRRRYDPTTRRLLAVEAEPAEAAVVRRIAEDALAGKPLRQVARELNAEGVPSPRDAVSLRRGREVAQPSQWASRTVKAMLLNRAYVGKRVHREYDRFTGRVLAEAEHAATWPAILDEAQHDRLAAMLTDPSRNKRPDNRAAVKHWLSGVLACSLCGSPMRHSSASNHKPFYRCTDCRRVTVDETVEELVAEVLVARLARPDAAEAFDGSDPDADAAREELRATTERLEELGTAFAEDRISLQAFTAADAKLRERAEEAKAVLARTSWSLPGFAVGLEDVREAWNGWDAPAKRQVAGALLERVVVAPTGRTGRPPKGTRPVNPERLAFVWRAA